jgi:alkylation response protein AidB-like acyl-CoA dehydrogenase
LSETSAVLGELDAFLTATLPEGWLESPGRRPVLDRAAFLCALGGAGWTVPHWAPEHGGRGLDTAAAVAVLDRLTDWGVPRRPVGSGIQLAGPTILAWSTDEVKRRFLPPIATGEERWCQLFSEPGAGSDLASLATSAVPDGDEWVANGQKVWTTLAEESEFGMLLARTDPGAPKHQGITYFGVDMRSPGVTIRPLINMAGEHEFSEVFLTDVRIPDAHRISPVGEGWRAAMTTLDAERLTLSGSRRSGSGRSENGIQGGKSIDEVRALVVGAGRRRDPTVRDRLMALHSRQQALRWTQRRARAGGPAASITKLMKSELNQSIQELAVTALGAGAQAWPVDGDGDGDRDPSSVDPGGAEIAHHFLRTRANTIEGGSSEVQRTIVGERILGLPREPDPYKGAPWRDVPRS